MLSLLCPYCDIYVDETDLTAGGQAHIARPAPGASDDAFEAYLFLRQNPKGVHFERWRHTYGCGKWFHVARCTQTLEVFGTYPAQMVLPPPDIIDVINARRPGWRWGTLAGETL